MLSYNLPVHALPLPVNPLKQRHTYEPSVFTQTAFSSQRPLNDTEEHSSTSENRKKKINLYKKALSIIKTQH